FQESARAIVRREQRQDVPLHAGPIGCLALDEGAALGGRTIERLVKQLVDLGPDLGGLWPIAHARSAPSSSRSSHARANVQCRFTVASEISSAAAVSGTDIPPKYRSSTRRACCASMVASRSSARSRARRSTSCEGDA